MCNNLRKLKRGYGSGKIPISKPEGYDLYGGVWVAVYPVIAFQLLFAGLPCIQPVIALLAAVQCKFHNAVILTISRHKLNGTFHQLFYVAFTESHGAHDSIVSSILAKLKVL